MTRFFLSYLTFMCIDIALGFANFTLFLVVNDDWLRLFILVVAILLGGFAYLNHRKAKLLIESFEAEMNAIMNCSQPKRRLMKNNKIYRRHGKKIKSI